MQQSFCSLRKTLGFELKSWHLDDYVRHVLHLISAFPFMSIKLKNRKKQWNQFYVFNNNLNNFESFEFNLENENERVKSNGGKKPACYRLLVLFNLRFKQQPKNYMYVENIFIS